MKRRGERAASAPQDALKEISGLLRYAFCPNPHTNYFNWMMENIDNLYSIFLSCGSRVTTDSRKISGGELFFALKGENFDGNAYALAALGAGAAYAVVDEGADVVRDNPGNDRLVPVPDTLKALWALARHHRDQFSIPVLGLTGTNGKTTTKELVNAVLSAKYRTHSTCGNLNNNIGVPLTVLGITSETEIAVVEMGASHPGDIDELVAICAPDYGLITNVGKAHILGFGSFEGVKATKGELYDFLSRERAGKGGIFLNADNPHLCAMASDRSLEEKGVKIMRYGLEYSGARILESNSEHPFLSLSLGDSRIVRTQLVGSYNADNVLAALRVGEFFGVPETDAIAAIEAYTPSNNRSQMQRTSRNILIVDAYNANPSSMKAALDNFDHFEAEKKIVLLGDMLELGEDSLTEHRRIVERLSQSGLEAYFVGEEFKAAGAPNCFDTSDSLAAYIAANPTDFSGAAILVKGSRGKRMEKTIPVL